jgi:hypothetical protein
MRIKLTLRNKLTAEISHEIITVDSPKDAKDDFESPSVQVISTKILGQEEVKPVKSTYVPIRILRNRKEQELCDKAMGLGKFAPLTAEEQAELQNEIAMLGD